jgi:hypothetical protein
MSDRGIRENRRCLALRERRTDATGDPGTRLRGPAETARVQHWTSVRTKSRGVASERRRPTTQTLEHSYRSTAAAYALQTGPSALLVLPGSEDGHRVAGPLPLAPHILLRARSGEGGPAVWQG